MPTPYLLFDGDCAQATAYYTQALGAQVVHLSTYADAPGAEDLTQADHERGERVTVALRQADKAHRVRRAPPPLRVTEPRLFGVSAHRPRCP